MVTWTEDKDAEFARLRLARTPVREIAETFGTTVGAVYAHATALGLRVMVRKEWSEAEVVDLLSMDDARVPIREMARRLGRSEHSVSWKLDAKGRSASRMRYWKADDSRLAEMVAVGSAPKDVAADLGRSVEAVRGRVCTLGLGGNRRRRWEEGETERLRALVAEGNGAECVAAAIGRDAGSVKAKAYALGLVFSSPERVLTEEEVEGLRCALMRKGGMVDYAASLGVGVRWLRERAREAGCAVQTRRKLPLDEAAIAAIVEAARDGVAITDAVRDLGRDARTLKKVAAEAGVPFADRKKAVPKPRMVRVRLARPDGPSRAGGPVERRAGGAVLAKAVPPRLAPEVATAAAVAKPKASPERVAFAGARRGALARAGGDRVPADRASMDAAVAKFLAFRDVTRESVDPVEETVRAIRRRGYAVTRDEDAFVVDGRTRLVDVDGLAAFAAARGIAVPNRLSVG